MGDSHALFVTLSGPGALALDSVFLLSSVCHLILLPLASDGRMEDLSSHPRTGCVKRACQSSSRKLGDIGITKRLSLLVLFYVTRSANASPTACAPADDAGDCAAMLDIAAAWPAWGGDVNSGTSVCSWASVTCTSGRVTQL